MRRDPNTPKRMTTEIPKRTKVESAKKPKRIKSDPAQLIKMVKDAVDQKEIMAHFSFKTATQLTVADTTTP